MKKTSKKTTKKNLRVKNFNPKNQHHLMILSAIICGSDCDFELPAVDFADCDPETNESQIVKIYEAKANAADFADWTDAAEWTARLSQTSTDADAIREYTVIGD